MRIPWFRTAGIALIALAVPSYCQVRGTADKSAVANFLDLSRSGEMTPAAPRRAHRHPRIDRGTAATAIAPSAEAPRAAQEPGAALPFSGFQGLLDNYTAIPPDTMGAVGPQHVMSALNTEVLIQTRTGTVARARVTLDNFWSPIVTTRDSFDPRLMYDASGKRWIASSVVDSEKDTSALVVAVSQTSDPTSTWYMFKFDLGSSGSWGDYDVLGFNGNWVVVSVNLFRIRGGTYQRTDLYVFNKADIYANKGTFVRFSDNFDTFVPVVDYDNNNPNRIFLIQGGADGRGAGAVRLSDIHGTPGAELAGLGLATMQVTDGWSGEAPGLNDFLPQKDSGVKIDAGDDRIQNCVLRNGTVWCTHTIYLPFGVPLRTAAQWFQIDPIKYQILQRGRIEDPTNAVSYAYPSIAVNKNNEAVIGLNRFGANLYPTASFAYRAPSDAPNTFQADTIFKPGEAPYVSSSTKSNRWGDYSATLVDPLDDLTFWTLQEYAATPTAPNTGRFGTWWAQITPPSVEQNCTFLVAPLQQLFAGDGGMGSVSVAAPTACGWSAAANAGWITITSGSPANGPGSVAFTVAANPGTLRTGTILIAGQTLTITQAAAALLPDLTVPEVAAPASATPNTPFTVTATIRNAGNNSTGTFRAGIYLSASQAITATDLFLGSCTFASLAPTTIVVCSQSVTIPRSAAPGAYYIGAIADDRGALAESNETNNSASTPITVTGALRPVISAEGVVNSASYQGGAVAPGEIVTIFGSNLGDATISYPPIVNGIVGTTAGGTRVLIDGVAAPLVYALNGQVSTVAPFALADRTSTQIEVEYVGTRSAGVVVPVVAAIPAIYTVNQSGSGPAAVLNQDFSVNEAANPAARGSVIQIYATGGGKMQQPITEGALAVPPFPTLAAAVSVRVGGVPAVVQYSGAAPGIVMGGLQINAFVPDSVIPGDNVALDITIGSVRSPNGPTIAVR